MLLVLHVNRVAPDHRPGPGRDAFHRAAPGVRAGHIHALRVQRGEPVCDILHHILLWRGDVGVGDDVSAVHLRRRLVFPLRRSAHDGAVVRGFPRLGAGAPEDRYRAA